MLYVPALAQKDFLLSTIESSTKGTPPRNYNNTNKEYTTPTLTLLHRRVGTKPSTK